MEAESAKRRDLWLRARLNLSVAWPNDPAMRTALVWHDERSDGRLSFMVYPVTATLVAGFRASPGWAVRAGVGRIPRLQRALASLRNGDLFVWVGPFSLANRPELPFSALRQRGVRLVLYSTEPGQYCPFKTKHADEVWSFGWANLEGCMRSCRQVFPHPFNGTRHATFECLKGIARDTPKLTLRFVPPGYIRPPPEALSDAAIDQGGRRPVAFGDPNATADCLRLRFLGAVQPRHGLHPSHRRDVCFGKLKAVLGDVLVQTYSAWEDDSFGAILRADPFYLNIHKGCEASGQSAVTFRISRILSMPGGRIVLSEHCSPMDEREFEGLVHFLPQAGIPDMFRRLCRDGKRWRAEARRAHRTFRERFAPKLLFQQAGILTLLQRLRSGIGPMSGAGAHRIGMEDATRLSDTHSHVPVGIPIVSNDTPRGRI